jgi:hypothetical protein
MNLSDIISMDTLSANDSFIWKAQLSPTVPAPTTHTFIVLDLTSPLYTSCCVTFTTDARDLLIIVRSNLGNFASTWSSTCYFANTWKRQKVSETTQILKHSTKHADRDFLLGFAKSKSVDVEFRNKKRRRDPGGSDVTLN